MWMQTHNFDYLLQVGGQSGLQDQPSEVFETLGRLNEQQLKVLSLTL